MSRFAKLFGSFSLAIIAIGSAAVAAGHQTKAGPILVLPPPVRPHLIVGSPSPMPSPISSAGPPQNPIRPGAGVVVPEPSMAARPPNIGYQSAPNFARGKMNKDHGTLSASLHSTLLTRPHISHHVINQVVNVSSPAPTGINHWWDYEEDEIPGIGKYMINVGPGNLIVQADDMAVPNKGIELAFRRTYNSLSQHDYVNTDGSVPSNYGDGWTNTFDAHVSPNSSGSWSVYDIDGARYDYGAQIPGSNPACYTPPAGQFATLCSDGANGLYWTKKTGTVYYFFTGSGGTPVFAGRLHEIFGRHHNNYLLFQYFVDTGKPFTYQYLNKITVTTESLTNNVATLTFGDVTINNVLYRELASVQFPDGTTSVSYAYSSNNANGASLTEVDEPGNGSTSGSIPQQYSYTGRLDKVSSPRWILSHLPHQNPDGMQLEFFFTTQSNMVAGVSYTGNMDPIIPIINSSPNPVPSSQVQPGYSPAPFLYRTVTVGYPSPNSENCASGAATATDWSDSDGHHTAYCVDTAGRVVESHDYTGDVSPGPPYLVLKQSWDTNNDLIATFDARSNETDYAYDVNGNTIAAAAPLTSGYRPTTLIQYDGNNNVLAYCDPVWSHPKHDWYPPASPDPCPAQNGVTKYTWQAPTAGSDPFGELKTMTNPLGYTSTFSYDIAPQGGNDFGLPTKVLGTGIDQSAYGGSFITPTKTLNYDNNGNIVCYSDGQGTWALQYDGGGLGRLVAADDPDDSLRSGCTAVPTASAIATRYVYYPDGRINTSQSPAEHTAGKFSSFTYDPDGNSVTEQHWYGVGPTDSFSPPPTQKFYDGADRLVEVVEPQDGRTKNGLAVDALPNPWIVRYLYDLTQNGTKGSISMTGGSTFSAHGNLYKTQQYLQSIIVYEWNDFSSPSPVVPTWVDEKGSAFDMLDRPVRGFSYPPSLGSLEISNVTYDGTSTTVGFKNKDCNAASECTNLDYDTNGRVSKTTFTGPTPTPELDYTYDPDGHVLTQDSATYGTETYIYNPIELPTSMTEPSLGGVTSPATLTYTYYINGARSSLGVAASGLSGKALSYDYAYQSNGVLSNQNVKYGSDSYPFAWHRTAGDREQSDDDYTGNGIHTFGSNTDGTIASYTMAQTKLSPITRDDEGDINGYSATNGFLPQNPTVPVTSVRRESVFDGITPLAPPQYSAAYGSSQFANGFAVPSLGCAVVQIPKGGQHYLDCSGTTYDARAGAVLDIGPGNGPPPPNPAYPINPNVYPIEYTYDAVGRQSGAFQANANGGVDFSRSYDAENHLIGQTDTGWLFSTGFLNQQLASRSDCFYLAYGWGPNSHPITAGATITNSSFGNGCTMPPQSTLKSDTLHWDGDTVLFTSNSNGLVDDIKVDNRADILPLDTNYPNTKMVVWDRDLGGSLISDHNLSGHDAAAPADEFMRNLRTSGTLPSQGFIAPTGFVTPFQGAGTNPNVGQGGIITELKSDGFTDGYNVIQGVRSFDPQLGTWTTPDVYAGEVDDPMSQKSYMWNGNNPIAYADPTGFCPGAVEGTRGCMGGIYWPNIDSGANVLFFITSFFAPGEFEIDLARAAEVGADAYRASRAASKIADVVLGQSKDNYVGKAIELGGTYLNLAPKVWKGMTLAEKWAANKGFLDTAVNDGAAFKLISNPNKATDFYKEELDYLTGLGYTFNHDMTYLIPPK